jgi:hypothetical protein
MNGITNIFGSLLTYGIGHIHSSVLKPYQVCWDCVDVVCHC